MAGTVPSSMERRARNGLIYCPQLADTLSCGGLSNRYHFSLTEVQSGVNTSTAQRIKIQGCGQQPTETDCRAISLISVTSKEITKITPKSRNKHRK
jgi:hypothetical protein